MCPAGVPLSIKVAVKNYYYDYYYWKDSEYQKCVNGIQPATMALRDNSGIKRPKRSWMMENGVNNIKQMNKYICTTCALQEISPAEVLNHFCVDT